MRHPAFNLISPMERRFARLPPAQRQVDALMPALLARAFAGNLVSRDPTGEPAEKFRERICRESESQ